MARYAAIIGTGSYLPETVLTNFDLEKMVDTSDEWIRQRTGIVERRIAEDDIATSDLSVQAARLAIKKAQIDPLEIQMILVATVTPDTFFPSTACYGTGLQCSTKESRLALTLSLLWRTRRVFSLSSLRSYLPNLWQIACPKRNTLEGPSRVGK